MATKSMKYDHPAYIVPQFAPVQVKAVAASTLALAIPFTYPVTVKKVSAIVNVAGTNAAAGWDIYNGTTSVGAITAGTNTALTSLTDVVSDISVAAGSYLEIRTKANSATLAGDFLIEFLPTPGSNVTS